MKRISIAVLALSIIGVAGCGGGGGSGPTPTPTTDAQKAASASSVQATQEATGFAVAQTLGQFMPTTDVSAKDADGTKASSTQNINVTENCNDDGGGSYTATGTLTADCTLDGTIATCDISQSNVSITFADCAKSATIGTTTYDTTLTGAATGSLTGSISADISTDPPTIASLNFNGTLGGTPTVGGDISGTVNLSGISFVGVGTSDTDQTCSGTCTILLAGGTEAVCGIASACNTCSQ